MKYEICDPRLKEPHEIIPDEETIRKNKASGEIIGGSCRYKPSVKNKGEENK